MYRVRLIGFGLVIVDRDRAVDPGGRTGCGPPRLNPIFRRLLRSVGTPRPARRAIPSAGSIPSSV